MQVQVPQKFSSLPPLLLAVPKSWQAKDQKNRISTQSWCKSPKEILSSTYVGGDCNTSQIPLALVSSKNQVEVQSLAFVPTRIAITSLKKSSQATIEVVNSKGKRLTLGKASTDSTGRLLLPPLTLGKTGIAVTVRILISGARTYEFVLRTIK
jgi:hypothetical protein